MLIKIRLGDEAASRLIEEATRNLRPINWQAEMILSDALGVRRERRGLIKTDHAEVKPCKPI